MERMLLLAVLFGSSSLVSLASIGTDVSPAMAAEFLPAEPREFGSVVDALVSPTSSERFFEEGRQQLEQEIQRLQQGSNAQTVDILKIDPAISQQQQNLQQDQYLLDGVHAP
ncbi:MAG: hypothetical protein AAGE59_27875 [Cyanobacteria bacterium P01_F01_bin.86]